MKRLPPRFLARLRPSLTFNTALTSLVAFAVLVLTGCATPGDVASTAKPLAPAAVGLQAGATSPRIDAQWWRALGDPSLDALVDTTLAHNPNLGVAQARLQRAQASAQAARGAQLPQVGASAEAMHQRYPEHGLIPPPYAGTVRDTATLQLGLSWELDFFGRNQAALAAALGGERAAAADAQAARVLLSANVVRGYVQLARLIEQRSIADRALAQRSEVLSLIQQRVRAGLDTSVELRQGEGALPQTRTQIEALDEQITLQRHALATLSGQAPNALDSFSPKLATLAMVAPPQTLGADLLGQRADIQAARERIEAATQDVAVARTQFYPSVNLTAFVGLSSLGLNNLIDTGSRQFGVGPALSLPIFDAGRLRANLRGRTADLDGAIESYNGALLEALHEVADSLTSIGSVQRQQREQQQALDSAESAYDLALQRFKAGLGGYLTVLTAEATVLDQRRASADLKARALDTQVGLIRGLGGGYQATSL